MQSLSEKRKGENTSKLILKTLIPKPGKEITMQNKHKKLSKTTDEYPS